MMQMVNKNVNLAAGCSIVNLNKPSEIRASSVVGCSFKLPKTKAEFQQVEESFDHYRSTIDMTGKAKVLLREKLSSNSQISFSGEFNPFYDQYSFG